MSSRWVTTEMDEFGGFHRDWYGPYVSEADAEQAAQPLSKQSQEMVAETVFGVAGCNGTRFAEFVKGKRYSSGGSGWFAVKPSPSVAIPAAAQGKYPPA